jgi:hypothetical protein
MKCSFLSREYIIRAVSQLHNLSFSFDFIFASLSNIHHSTIERNNQYSTNMFSASIFLLALSSLANAALNTTQSYKLRTQLLLCSSDKQEFANLYL